MDLWTCHLGVVEYREAVEFQERLRARVQAGELPDLLLLLEHPPVYTLGRRSEAAELPVQQSDIDVVPTERGGKLTYHGPGQLVVYPLIDIRRAGLGVRDLVTALERAVISYCASFGIKAECRKNAPGVYVEGRKIASVGLRIRRGASYHGLAFNVNMELEPFQRINPCGYAGLQMTQLAEQGQPDATVEATGRAFATYLLKELEAVRKR